MEDYQQRVVDEQAALVKKINALDEFTIGVVFANLPDAEKARMEMQLSLMEQYSAVLGERITAFSEG